jgi:Ras-related protein Rab-28
MQQIDLPGGVRVIMQTWDIGGQGLGSKMLRNYIFGEPSRSYYTSV